MIGTKEALEARDNLRWIVARWPALHSHLAPTTGNAARHTPVAKSKPPLALHVLDLMHEIEQATRYYGHTLLDETHDWTPRTSAMPGLLDDIAMRHGHWTAGDDEQTALAFCDWAHDTSEKVRRITEQPAPATWIGPCRNSDNPDLLCRGHLYVRRQLVATCPECGATTDVVERREWMAQQLEDRLMTRGEIIAALTILETEVKVRTLDKWIERRHLLAAFPGMTPQLYPFKDAKALAERHHARRVGERVNA